MRKLFTSLFKNQSLNPSDLYTIARKFAAILLGPAQNLAGGIDSLSQHPEAGRAGQLLSSISADIQSGTTLSQAFQKHEQRLGSFFHSIITKGEASGNAGVAFLKLSEYYEKRDSFRKKIIRSLKYPLIILLGTTGCFLTLLLFFIPPVLRTVWTKSENLPAAINAAASAATFIQMHPAEIAFFSVAVVALFFWIRQSSLKSSWLSALTWNIPIIGDIARKKSLYRFSLALSTLLSCGFKNTHALTISAGELRNYPLEKRILHALVDTIHDSESIFTVLKKLSIFPSLVIDMSMNEKKTNQSSDQLKKIALFYQNEVESAFNAFSIIIGPVYVSVAGLVGLSLLLSLYLPVFKLVGNQ